MEIVDVRDPTPSQHAEIAASLEGQLIAGKYRIERLIGVGGMGVVVSALHLDLERYVAIKLIREELTRDRNTLQRFLLEARAAAKMTNEHICRVLDVDKLENGTPFIVMELLQGRDLAAILRERGRVEPVECVDWVLQACEGVAEAHALRIVHRDLKPDNLFMTRLGDGTACVKVLDFGISKAGGASVTGSLTAPRTMVGSPRYMAPEQMLFSAADERSDVWALGTILYELLSGTPAFAGDSVATICARVIHEPPVPPRVRAPEVSLELQRVILRCLERDPNTRYASVAALAADLAPFGSAAAAVSSRKIATTLGNTPSAPPSPLSYLAPHPPSTNDPTALVAPTRTARRHRPWLWLSVPLLLFGGALVLRSFSSPRLEVAQGSAVVMPAPAALASAGPQAAAEELPRSETAAPGTRLSTAAGAAPGPARVPASAPPEPAVPAPSSDKPLARRTPARSRPDVPTPSNVQEAWDVRKFGGRE